MIYFYLGRKPGHGPNGHNDRALWLYVSKDGFPEWKYRPAMEYQRAHPRTVYPSLLRVMSALRKSVVGRISVAPTV
jgi:hypothetical protein